MGGKCPCANPPGKGSVRPMPRKPNVKKESIKLIDNVEEVISQVKEKRRISRYRWILTHMSSIVTQYAVEKPRQYKNIGGFLPETRRKK